MQSFIESISYQQEQMPLLHWHQQRFVRTQLANFGQLLYPDLRAAMAAFQAPTDDKKYKCRVEYSAENLDLAFIPYLPRVIKRLVLRTADKIHYGFKSTDRSQLNALTKGLHPDEEILIIREGYLTDSSFSNIALYSNGDWLTPEAPLLEGVHRQFLLEKGILKMAAIHLNNIKLFSKIRLINAMTDWEHAWELPVSAINLRQGF